MKKKLPTKRSSKRPIPILSPIRYASKRVRRPFLEQLRIWSACAKDALGSLFVWPDSYTTIFVKLKEGDEGYDTASFEMHYNSFPIKFSWDGTNNEWQRDESLARLEKLGIAPKPAKKR